MYEFWQIFAVSATEKHTIFNILKVIIKFYIALVNRLTQYANFCAPIKTSQIEVLPACTYFHQQCAFFSITSTVTVRLLTFTDINLLTVDPDLQVASLTFACSVDH